MSDSKIVQFRRAFFHVVLHSGGSACEVNNVPCSRTRGWSAIVRKRFKTLGQKPRYLLNLMCAREGSTCCKCQNRGTFWKTSRCQQCSNLVYLFWVFLLLDFMFLKGRSTRCSRFARFCYKPPDNYMQKFFILPN